MLFTDTYAQAERFAGGKVTCNHCHPNGGQREKALPLVGVDKVFPEYNPRSGRLFTLEERIVGCMLRSINATGRMNQHVVLHHENELDGATLSPVSGEIQDLAAYIRWLSWNRDIDSTLPWRGQNTLPASARIPLEKLDSRLGQQLFLEKCANCHGEDGQGMFIGDKRPGPLWGPESWNDGAGAARTYTLAGFILNWMPYMNPGSLTSEEAQHIAAYITSQPRPHFPYQDQDYLTAKIPVDAVYYKKLYSQNPLSKK
ncbi:MAG: c-type cytochrome [Ignavibacteriae bacterium]|nr:c-type cytochrome [Ignavibacteriota bacterium]